MTTSIQKVFLAMMILVAITSVSSCKKDKFDEPPGNTTDPNLDTISIGRLKAYYTGGSPVTIPDDVTIAGIVIADDRTGNFYKSIVIDDGHDGLAISIDVSSGLYTDYPVGRKIYVKCKGLALGTYGGTPQLGGYVDGASVGRIGQSLLPKVIVKGPTGNDITPLIQHVNISDLNDSYLSRLVEFDSAEFVPSSANKTYAEVNSAIPDVGERFLTTCPDGVAKTINVRTSAFCTFAYAKTPRGNGKILGVYTTYNGDAQLTLRDTTDIDMNGIKCDGSGLNDITHVYEDFESASTSGNLAVTGWVNYYVTGEGSKKWKATNQSGSKMAYMTAFGTPNETVNIAWLVTPGFDLSSTVNDTFSFTYTDRFTNPATLDVLYSTDYSGSGNPNAATWTSIPGVTISSGNNATLVESGKISLNDINATNVHIAFRYSGGYGPPQKTSNIYIDNVKVTGKLP